MTEVGLVLIGALVASCCLWGGFYLGRLGKTEAPMVPSRPESFDGAVLDAAVYPYEVDDE